MTNRKPYPILSALRSEGDTATLGALRLWPWIDWSSIHAARQILATQQKPHYKKALEAAGRKVKETMARLDEIFVADDYIKSSIADNQSGMLRVPKETEEQLNSTVGERMPTIKDAETAVRINKSLEDVQRKIGLNKRLPPIEITISSPYVGEVTFSVGDVGFDRTANFLHHALVHKEQCYSKQLNELGFETKESVGGNLSNSLFWREKGISATHIAASRIAQ